MDTKIVYQYNKNGIYIGEFTLDNTDKSPISGRWQIPAYMTEVVPPQEKEGFNRTWNGEAWEYVEIPKEPEPPTLEKSKADKIAEFKMKRDTKEVADIEYNGHLFDYDDQAQKRINVAYQRLESNPSASVMWTTANNDDVPMTFADFAGLLDAVMFRSNALHVKYRELKDAVNACSTIEEVEAITWEE